MRSEKPEISAEELLARLVEWRPHLPAMELRIALFLVRWRYFLGTPGFPHTELSQLWLHIGGSTRGITSGMNTRVRMGLVREEWTLLGAVLYRLDVDWKLPDSEEP